MKFFKSLLFTIVLISMEAKADSTNINSLAFANEYANAWFETQKSTATPEDLEHYLSFLTDDVAYQHLPYDTTDERKKGGKEELRMGMKQWLGSNTSYVATINSVNFSNNIIIINYNSATTIVDAKTKTQKVMRRDVIDTLELDNNKVSVIRKYW